MHYIVFTTIINDNFGIHKFYPVLPMGKTYPFTHFYPTGFTQWVKRTMPTLRPNVLQYINCRRPDADQQLHCGLINVRSLGGSTAAVVQSIMYAD